jgi:hypothetical protein
VRYEGDNGDEPDLELVDAVNTVDLNTTGKGYHGKLSTLLEWHKADPVDSFEINRNNVIYSFQENRNPFIDHPEYVTSIWDTVPPSLNCINDIIPPNIYCSGTTIIQLDEDGIYALTYDMLADSIWDACGIDTVLLDKYIVDCDDIGKTTITIDAYDVSGNLCTCIADIEVTGNVPPIVENDTVFTEINTPVDIAVIVNDYDPKTSINIASLGVLISPSHGSVLVDKTTGIVTYTPVLDYVGNDVFRYSICDDAIPCFPMCDEALVFITVDESTLIDYHETSSNIQPNLYPNPATDYVIIEMPDNTEANGVLYSMMGSKVAEFSGKGKITVKTSDLDSGCYCVRIVSKEKVYQSKIIIQD